MSSRLTAELQALLHRENLGLLQGSLPQTQCGCSYCHAAQVLRVHVSPCRLKALPPEMQTGHRVIRHFSNPDNANR